MRKKVTTASLVVLMISVTVWLFSSRNRLPLLSILFSHYETNDDYRCGVLLMTNGGSGAACYEGYGGDSPLYDMMLQSSSGWVPDAGGWWCGTGVKPCILAAGSTVTFRVHFRTNQNWKVGIPYYAPTMYDRMPRFVRGYLKPFGTPPKSQVAWSEGIEYDSKR